MLTDDRHGQFMRDELEVAGIANKLKPTDLRVMKTLLCLHHRIDRVEAEMRRAERPWWQRWFHGECK